MRVLIVYAGAYPGVAASAGRVQRFARGLRAQGANAFLLALNAAHRSPGQGRWHTDGYGVPYTLVSRSPSGRFDLLRTLLERPRLLARRAEEVFDQSRIDVAMLYGASWHAFRPVLELCHRRGVPVLMDFVEWYRIRMNLTWNPLFWDQQVLYRRILSCLSGAVCISRLWARHARSRGVPTIRIPAIGEAEPACLDHPANTEPTPFTAAYLGRLAARDLPQTMLAGVARAAERGLDLRLVVVGSVDAKGPARCAVREAQSHPRLKDRVTLTGWVSQEQLQRRLADAGALLLLRPDTWETRACFPTRLPEYLLSGRPVIMSDVGDTGLYFRHRENAWLLPPGDRPGKLAEALMHLASHPDEATSIGRAGQKTAIREFSYVKHGRRLLAFLERLRRRMRGDGEAL
jgi:glycosyltransferase involved in cell wall biosynthesis